MTLPYDVRSPKRPVNLSLNSDLLEKARSAGINLSAVAEKAISADLARLAQERWDAEVAEACAAHDRYLDAHGLLSEALLAQAEADAAQ